MLSPRRGCTSFLSASTTCSRLQALSCGVGGTSSVSDGFLVVVLWSASFRHVCAPGGDNRGQR